MQEIAPPRHFLDFRPWLFRNYHNLELSCGFFVALSCYVVWVCK
ncbi:hypothetical protein LINGRAHAP2_LOCUS3448, partial [Linum grandiflorum]